MTDLDRREVYRKDVITDVIFTSYFVDPEGLTKSRVQLE